MDYSKQVREKDPIDMKKFHTKYYNELYNLLSTIPILLVASIIFFTVSMFSTSREAKLSSYLEKASKWNEENMAEKFASIRL